MTQQAKIDSQRTKDTAPTPEVCHPPSPMAGHLWLDLHWQLTLPDSSLPSSQPLIPLYSPSGDPLLTCRPVSLCLAESSREIYYLDAHFIVWPLPIQLWTPSCHPWIHHLPQNSVSGPLILLFPNLSTTHSSGGLNAMPEHPGTD